MRIADARLRGELQIGTIAAAGIQLSGLRKGCKSVLVGRRVVVYCESIHPGFERLAGPNYVCVHPRSEACV